MEFLKFYHHRRFPHSELHLSICAISKPVTSCTSSNIDQHLQLCLVFNDWVSSLLASDAMEMFTPSLGRLFTMVARHDEPVPQHSSRLHNGHSFDSLFRWQPDVNGSWLQCSLVPQYPWPGTDSPSLQALQVAFSSTKLRKHYQSRNFLNDARRVVWALGKCFFIHRIFLSTNK